MKNIIIPIFLIITLSSCSFFSKNEENILNNSWSIVSENSSQTENQETNSWSENISENKKQEHLPTEYEVVAEKTYFYTNPTDETPRKAYLMKWDTFSVNIEKSTENMVFASFTNSVWKTTEWFLKKSEVKEVMSTDIAGNPTKTYDFTGWKPISLETNVSESSWNKSQKYNCKIEYELPVWWENSMGAVFIAGYRKFEFNIVWGCKTQKIKGTDDMWAEWFSLPTGEKSRIMNFMMELTFWVPGWCNIPKPTFSKKISKNNFEINIEAGREYCTFEDNYTGNHRIDIRIADKWDDEAIFWIFFDEVDKNNLEKIYNEMLWTLENGFFETGKKITKSDVEKARMKSQQEIEKQFEKEEEQREKEKLKKISDTKWTDELLEKAEFWDDADFIRLYYDNKNFFVIHTWMNEKWWAILGCNGDWRFFSECKIDKIANGFIYWKSSSNYYSDGGWYHYNEYWEIQYKTNIKNETTEKIKEVNNKSCVDYDWNTIKCD